MGLYLYDLVDREREFKVNWWNWRPTLTIIETSDLAQNYGASRDWLERFAAFCAECNGFEVI